MTWSIVWILLHSVLVNGLPGQHDGLPGQHDGLPGQHDGLPGQPENINLNIYSYKSEKLEDLCGRNVIVQKYINIQSQFQGGETCVVTFSTKENKTALTLYFLEYYASDKCAGPINILNSKGQPLLGLNGYCGTQKPREYFNLGIHGALRIVRPDKTIETELRVIEYFWKNESCPPGTFDCQYQNLCITESLTCDFYPDCPKGMDEQNKCADNKQVGFYVFFGILAMLCFICVGVVVFCEEMSRRKRGNPPLNAGNLVLQPNPFDVAKTGSLMSADASQRDSQTHIINRTMTSVTSSTGGFPFLLPGRETFV